MKRPVVHRIEVALKDGVVDSMGREVRRAIVEDLSIEVDSVRTVKVFTIEADLNTGELERLGEGLFTDPIVERFTIDEPIASDFSWLIEVGFRPGVTDNVGKTSLEGMRDMFGRPFNEGEGVYTSRQYLIQGNLGRDEVKRIATDLLANELIERWEVLSIEEWREGKKIAVTVPKVSGKAESRVREFDLEVSDERLMSISEEGILSLSLEEMKAIRDHYRREEVRRRRKRIGLGGHPTDLELECLAQTWSEHCKHKIFNAIIAYEEDGRSRVVDSLFNTYIRGTTDEVSRKVDWLLSVFHDNAGVVKLTDDWSLVMKVETHNSPSALDPYGGALTGIVGVNRDPLGTGLGARLIFNTDVFCFAPPKDFGELPPRLLHPKRIFRGVHRGVKDGGNQSGIPVVNGAILFDERYKGKPLVFCGTGGIMPARVAGQKSHRKSVQPGDLIVMVGGRIGKDGIHGATFSSVELTEGSPATAVQIGDPITQKKMIDFLLEARDLGLYRCITDNGAGGLSSSVGETARMSGGAELHLERAPLKYEGLAPWEILLSEAQERMTCAVGPEKIGEFQELASRRGVESTVLGNYTDSGYFHILHEGRTVGYLDMEFLHEGLPRMELVAKWKKPAHREPELPAPGDMNEMLKRILGRINVCSKESWVRQYDHEVQGGSVVKPFVGKNSDGPSDAAVVKPILHLNVGVIVANGIVPRYSDIDTYNMVACSIDEAVRNAIAVGGSLDYIAGLDNFCWPDPIQSGKTPDGHYKLAQLVRANMALKDYCTAYGIPLISGKDSMKNDYGVPPEKISIPPTLLFTVLGKMEDASLAVTMDVKRPGDLVYVVGMTRHELGGSEYYAQFGHIGNSVPSVDANLAREIYTRISALTRAGAVNSCHDCSDGGLGVCLAESAFAGGLGMEVDLRHVPREGVERDDLILFSESQSRFVITIDPEKKEVFEREIEGVPYGLLGRVSRDDRFQIRGTDGALIVSETVGELKLAWKEPLLW
ncbi:MAG: phosphoribosylformylglycinamidine synthase subunit PurS [Candidatus Glassbacteria bacterium]